MALSSSCVHRGLASRVSWACGEAPQQVCRVSTGTTWIPVRALPSGWCIEDSGWEQMLSVSVSWMPASARLFEKRFLHADVSRDRTFCLDPGLFPSHPDHLPHLYLVNYLHLKSWLIPWVVRLLANCSGINQLVFQSKRGADKKPRNLKTNTKGGGMV